MSLGNDPPAANMFDVESIRRDFPLLQRTVHGKPLIWLDNAATTQKLLAVIYRVVHYYERENSNMHRGTHCALPILARFGLESSVRPSFAFSTRGTRWIY